MKQPPYKFVIQTTRRCRKCKEIALHGRYVAISRTRQRWLCERCT